MIIFQNSYLDPSLKIDGPLISSPPVQVSQTRKSTCVKTQEPYRGGGGGVRGGRRRDIILVLAGGGGGDPLVVRGGRTGGLGGVTLSWPRKGVGVVCTLSWRGGGEGQGGGGVPCPGSGGGGGGSGWGGGTLSWSRGALSWSILGTPSPPPFQ